MKFPAFRSSDRIAFGVVVATLCLAASACGDDSAAGSDATLAPDGSRDAGVLPDGARPDAGPGPDGGPGPDSGTDPDGGTYAYSCTPIGSGYSDGFFALESFNGKLYAGQFGYGHESQSMLYSYSPWQLVSPGLTGISESVCALKVFDGYLYANTESSGDIFRSPDGSTWERLYDGDSGSIGCGLAELGGELYAVNYGNQAGNHGRILRQVGTSWSIVYDSGSDPLYLRDINSFSNTLYAFGVQSGQPYMVTSSNGTDWVLGQVANRYFRGHVWQGFLWLGSASNYSASPTGVWRYDGSQFHQIHLEPSRSHITDIKDLSGKLFASTSNGWKTESGPSTLLMSPDGLTNYQTICTFSETAVWNMAVHDGELYLGTWEYGVGGSVYRVDYSLVPSANCNLISQANPAWEVCETGPTFCAGVFTDGAGCTAYCAPVGLPCTARFGGAENCVKEPQNIQSCGDNTGNMTDWCECGTR